jgi:type I restriction enzyme S subunit
VEQRFRQIPSKRTTKVLPEISPDQLEYNVPNGWKWVRLGQVIKLWNGFAFKSSDYQETGVPVIRIGDLQNGEIQLDQAVRVSESIAAGVTPEIWIPPDSIEPAKSSF